MSNLKIDIIYYQTSSDFEMEFNLSGCCRMRIFKDKIESKKEFVTALARNVSRSKIIIVVTDLFGNESIIPTLSKSIGLSLTSPDKNEFGIKTDENILMPETAVPLVTKAGIYGGCIIESGPQSIVIVSSIRSLRHEIMKTYVHNYIFDVGQLFAYQERMGQNSNNVNLSELHNTPQGHNDELVGVEIVKPEDANDTVSSQALPEEDDDVSAVILSTTLNDDVIPEPQTNDNAPGETADLEDVVSNSTFSNSSQNVSKVVPGVSDDGDIDLTPAVTSEQDNEKRAKRAKKSRATSIILLILVILLLIGFGILAYYFVYLPSMGIENNLFSDPNNAFAEFLNFG